MKTFRVCLKAGGFFHVHASSFGNEYGQGYTILKFFGKDLGETVVIIDKNLVRDVEEEETTRERQ
jgi:hypothetical protein